MEWNSPIVLVAATGVVLTAIGLVLTIIIQIFAAGKWKGKVDGLSSGLEKVWQETRVIQSDIKKIFQLIPKDPLSGQSPLRLNDLGEAISKTLNAKI